MARLGAIFNVGETVVSLLKARRDLRGPPPAAQPSDPLASMDIAQTSLAQLAKPSETPLDGLSLLLYRVLPSGHQRPQGAGRNAQRPTRLGLELHYLLTAWSLSPEKEQAFLTWAMLELHRFPLLDRSLFTGGEALWDAGESVHFVAEPLTHEALFRVWDALQPKYRLSAGYVARVVHLEEGASPEYPPVVQSRFGFANVEDALAMVAAS